MCYSGNCPYEDYEGDCQYVGPPYPCDSHDECLLDSEYEVQWLAEKAEAERHYETEE